MIPYGHQNINQADIDAVIAVLKSDYLTQGPCVPAFEQAVARYCGASRAVAVNSATAALHLACLALGVGPGQRVWTSPITFVASANCARFCGAIVDFVDVEPDTGLMAVAALRQKLEQAERVGALPQVVIPVHLAGHSCAMATIHRLAGQYGFRIIEDAAHALGGRYQDWPVGGCQYSDITAFSFHPVKIITTGEGGMALTQNPALAETMALLRSHGVTRDSQRMIGVSEGDWYYQQLALGFNYRMTDFQAALGRSQLARLDEFIARRRFLARRYDQALVNLPLATPVEAPEVKSAAHLYIVRLDEVRHDRQRIFAGLRARGIGVNVHYIPVHTQPYYQQLGFRRGDFPEAERFYQRIMTLPLYPDLDDAAQLTVIESLRELLT